MKNPILTVAFLLLPLLIFSQGVKFEQGSWKDALALAKQTDKPVLLNMYYSDENWLRDNFSRETVGDVCNTYFVCYKMDASKKEGLELAKKYGLTNRPAVLFINADGTLLSKYGRSYGGSSDFIEAARTLLQDFRSPKPITAWEAEYPKKKKDPAFLLEYIDKRSNLGLDYNEAFEAYIRLLPANGPMPLQAAKLFQSNTYRVMVTDYAFQYFFKNKKEFSKITDQRDTELENWYFESVVDHTIEVASMLKDEALLEKAIAAYWEIPYDSEKKHVEELYMNYYEKTKQLDKYIAHTRIFVADIFKKLDSEELLAKNDKSLKNFEERLASETDATRINQLKNMIDEQLNFKRNQICRQLNHIAWYLFKATSEKSVLEVILPWSEKSVQFNPTTADYLDTNAQILYKLGRKEEAIALQKRAVANNTNTNSTSYTAINETLKKMEAGENLR